MAERNSNAGSVAVDCDACSLHSRRDFLLRATAAVAAVSTLFPLVANADAMDGVVFARATRSADGAVRYPVPAADSASIDVENETILVRQGSQCMAFALSCPHQRAMLRVKRGEVGFQCPKHKSEYEASGVFIRGRATRNMDRRPIRKDGAELSVDVDSVLRSDDQQAAWLAAVVSI
jgi:Rieske Fe-S protein